MSPVDSEKGMAGAASAILLAAVLWPMGQSWRDRPHDSFPLSYYPMFTARRKATGRVTHLVGIDDHGRRRLLHYRLIGPGGMNQARRQLYRLARGPHAEEAAGAIAERVARGNRRRDGQLVEIRIVTGTYRFDDFFAGQREPMTELVHAAAAVPRGGP